MSTLRPEQWQEVSPYLDQALTLSESERAAWLVLIREQNRELADRLEALLAEHHELADKGFLERPPLLIAGDAPLPGQKLGAYTLVSPIGYGGMGTVWLAERSDGRFQRRAAVKFLSVALAGGGGEQRFKREGSFLARLAHPNIAGLVDAGVSAQGQPYLVLEHVEGEHIDRYCDERRLDLRARLRLFLDVLAAVAHAHANLIVHRDLKPSNVLVRNDGQVKLLDFGIAKLLETEQPTTATMLTQEGGGALTPAYAAPEQIKGEPVTTATDVYALGVLLYALLTGLHPAGAGTRSAAELLKAIVETEPQRASDAVNSVSEETEALAHIATKRATTADKLARVLCGDLDTIISKALKKNPQERYTSVTAFADDLRRYLMHEPISARPDTFVYRTRKFVRRHWLPVVAAAVVIATLSASLYEVNRERVIAERRFTQLRQLSNKILELDKAIRNLPGSTDARQKLVAASLVYLEGLASDARGNLDLTREVAEGYWQIARIQGVPVNLNLGEPVKAEASLKKAGDLLETVLASRPNDRLALFRSASIAHDRMILAEQVHRDDEAVAFAHKAAERMNKFLRRGDAQTSELHEAAGLYGNVALSLINMHRYQEAVPYARRMVELTRALPFAQYRAAQGLSLAALALRFQGDLEGALQSIQEARKLAEQAVYEDEISRTLNIYGVLLRQGLILGDDDGLNLDRPAEAIEPLQRAFDLVEAAARKDPNDAVSRTRVGNSGTMLGNILRHRDPQQALAVYDTAIRRFGEVRNSLPASRGEAMALASSSYALLSLHRASEAKQRVSRAVEILKETKDYSAEKVKLDSEMYVVFCAQADYEARQGDVSRAIQMYEQFLAKVTAAKPDPLNDLRDAPRMSRLYENLAALYRRSGEADKADSLQKMRMELWRAWDQKLPNNAFVHRQLEAIALPSPLIAKNSSHF